MPKSQAIQFGVLILACSLVLGLLSGCESTGWKEYPPDNGNPMVGQAMVVFDQDGDPYDLILFRNGNAVSTTTKVKQSGIYGVMGKWTASPDTVFITYEDGSKEAFVDYNGTIRRQEYYPLRPVTRTANRYEYGWVVKDAKAGFVGVWYCADPQDVEMHPKAKPAQYIMHLSSDGKATRSDMKDVTGTWIVTNDGAALITWPEGIVDSITSTGSGYEMRTWLKGTRPEQNGGIKTSPVRRGAF